MKTNEEFLIFNSNISNTGIFVPDNVDLTFNNSNLSNNDLSNKTASANYILNNNDTTDLSNTGIKINLNIDAFKKFVYEYDRVDGRENNRFIKWLNEDINMLWVGCYLNGKLLQTPEDKNTIEVNKELILDVYKQFKDNEFNTVLSSISDQINHLKR